VLACLLPPPLLAQEAPRITQIDVTGHRQVEESAIRLRLKTRVGDPFSVQRVREDVEALFKMGFFDNVEVDATPFEGGLRLTYRLTEKPTVRTVRIEGNAAIKEDVIRDKLDLAPGAVFSPQAVARNAEKIRAFYEEEGHYQAEVTGSHQAISEREVEVVFRIQEGEIFRIREVRIEGNQGLSARQVRKVMATEARFLLWFPPGILKKTDLAQDVERIKALYLDNGYLQIRVEEPQVIRDDVNHRLEVVVRVQEGPQYTVGEVRVTGATVFPREEILKDLRIAQAKVFSRDLLRRDLARLTDRYGEKGYVFVDIAPVTKTDEERKTIDLTFEVSEGRQAVLERIEIRGNTKTHDKVIRRQLELAEGDTFSSRELQRGRERLLALNYFEEVRPSTETGSAPEKLVLNLDVKEKPTGRIGFGAGFSTGSGVAGLLFLNEANLFGLGRRIGINVSAGTRTERYEVFYEDPAFLDTNYSLGVSLYKSERDFTDFDEGRTGGTITVGRRFLRFNRASLTYRLEEVTINNVSAVATSFIQQQVGTSTTSSLALGVSRDTRNSPLDPTRGYRVLATAEGAGGLLNFDTNFYKLELDGSLYHLLVEDWKVVGLLRGAIGFVESFSDTRSVPIQERYFLGGPFNLRGFDFRDVSPRDPATGERIGGNKFLLGQAEIQFPLWEEAISLRGAVFFDIGNVFAEGEPYELSFRTDAGVGIRLVTPLGPLRLDWGYNLDPRADERRSRIQFTVGRIF
jgi:outer membrane protein insertion porin family